jgi:DNA repair exonuclease SbcCD ATPase subunit
MIDAPDYAQDETALTLSLELTKKHLTTAEKQQKQAEAELDECHQEAEIQRETVAEQNRAFEQAEQETTYAQSAKQRFADELKVVLEKRKQQAKQALQQYLDQKQQVVSQKLSAIDLLKSDFEEQLLEFKTSWQDELSVLDEQIEELERQVEHKRDQNREQIKQLEGAFNQELANQDIDPNTLRELKQQIERLKSTIQAVTVRRDELNEYKTFMQTDWSKQRPELLEQETELKALAQQLDQQQISLVNQYQSKRTELSKVLLAVEKKFVWIEFFNHRN